MKNVAAVLAFAIALLGGTGCLGPIPPTLTCAPIGIQNGVPVALSRSEFNLVAPKLEPYLNERGYRLVSDVSSAARLVTIHYEPNPATPGVGTLQVLEIKVNSFRPPAVSSIWPPSDTGRNASSDGDISQDRRGFGIPPPDSRRD